MPLFVDEIIASIEARGLDMDGIYRISGNLSEVHKLRNQVDHGKFRLLSLLNIIIFRIKLSK